MEEERAISIVQGGYYLVTGLWPLVHIESFQRVSGPKIELWLVKTVGALIAVIGWALTAAGVRRRITPEIAALGLGSAAGLLGIDVVYVAKRRISPVYLLDALPEAVCIAAWARHWQAIQQQAPVLDVRTGGSTSIPAAPAQASPASTLQGIIGRLGRSYRSSAGR